MVDTTTRPAGSIAHAHKQRGRNAMRVIVIPRDTEQLAGLRKNKIKTSSARCCPQLEEKNREKFRECLGCYSQRSARFRSAELYLYRQYRPPRVLRLTSSTSSFTWTRRSCLATPSPPSLAWSGTELPWPRNWSSTSNYRRPHSSQTSQCECCSNAFPTVFIKINRP